jgi:hypothetical protein
MRMQLDWPKACFQPRKARSKNPLYYTADSALENCELISESSFLWLVGCTAVETKPDSKLKIFLGLRMARKWCPHSYSQIFILETKKKEALFCLSPYHWGRMTSLHVSFLSHAWSSQVRYCLISTAQHSTILSWLLCSITDEVGATNTRVISFSAPGMEGSREEVKLPEVMLLCLLETCCYFSLLSFWLSHMCCASHTHTQTYGLSTLNKH